MLRFYQLNDMLYCFVSCSLCVSCLICDLYKGLCTHCENGKKYLITRSFLMVALCSSMPLDSSKMSALGALMAMKFVGKVATILFHGGESNIVDGSTTRNMVFFSPFVAHL